MQKVKLLLEFYKSNMLVYTILYLISIYSEPYLLYINLSVVSIPIVYLIKNLRRNEYVFYHNQGISKVNLYGFCVFLNFLISTITIIFYEAFS